MTRSTFLSRFGSSLLILLPLTVILATGYWIFKNLRDDAGRTSRVISYIRNPQAHTGWNVRAKEKCGQAPFIIPTDGYIGYLWDDSFYPGHRHQGIDIFAGSEVNITAVYAAYPGYLTRKPDWKSSLIIRIPDDPLHPGRQIWTYYTHLAGPDGESFIAADFPPGAEEVFVEAGALLGYQGNYSGNPGNPVGVHLHFSIVLDDGQGRYLNELEIENTLDPSAYLGLPLNANLATEPIPQCSE